MGHLPPSSQFGSLFSRARSPNGYQIAKQILTKIFEDKSDNPESTFPTPLMVLLLEDLNIITPAAVQYSQADRARLVNRLRGEVRLSILPLLSTMMTLPTICSPPTGAKANRVSPFSLKRSPLAVRCFLKTRWTIRSPLRLNTTMSPKRTCSAATLPTRTRSPLPINGAILPVRTGNQPLPCLVRSSSQSSLTIALLMA